MEEAELKLEQEPNRIITGNDAENDRYEILDKIIKQKRESIMNFYKDKKKKIKIEIKFLLYGNMIIIK